MGLWPNRMARQWATSVQYSTVEFNSIGQFSTVQFSSAQFNLIRSNSPTLSTLILKSRPWAFLAVAGSSCSAVACDVYECRARSRSSVLFESAISDGG